MNSRLIELREVISKLVPMLAGKGLRVTQIGKKAYVQTDLRTRKPVLVNIPMIPDNAEESFIEAIQGFIDHEIGHVLVTDWNYYGGAPTPEEMKDPKVRAFQNTHNILEDTMIEREIVRIFPGAEKNIARLRNHFVEKITKPAVASAKDDKEMFRYLLVPVMRALAGHKEFQEYLDETGLWAQPYVDHLLRQFSPDYLKKLKTCTTTKETLALARELHDILYPPPPPAPSAAETGDMAEAISEPEESEDGESQDKPEKEANAGDGDGERDHVPSEDDEEEQPEPEADEDEKEEDAGEEEAEGEDEDEKDGADDEEEADDEGDEEADDNGAGDDEGDDSVEDETDDEEKSKKDTDGDEDDEDGEDDGDAGADGSSDDEDDSEEGDSSGASGSDDDEDEGDAGGSDGDDEEGDEQSGSASAGGDGEEGDEDGSDTSVDDDGSLTENKSPEDAELNDRDAESDGEEKGVGTESSKSMFDYEDDAFDAADMSSAFQQMISRTIEGMLEDRNVYVPLTRDLDEISPLVPPENINDKWVPEMEERVRSMTGRMQKDIERIMASQSHVHYTPGHKKGKLHAPSLYRISQGDPRVFQQKQEHVSKETAVTLLIDNSGSMGGIKMSTAMLAAFALSSTLDRVKIAHEVLGFTTGHRGNVPQVVRDALQREYSAGNVYIEYDRVEPIVMPIYKEFDERLSPLVKKRIAYAMNAQRGLAGNIDGESVEYAAMRLIKRPEKRKVMLVLSDGQPAGGRLCQPHLRTVVNDCEKKFGIEMIGIGIMDASVKRFYPKHVVLNNVDDLPGQVMTEIKKLLV